MKQILQGINLGQLSDGFAGRVINDALADAAADIKNRGGDGKPRKLVIELTFIPDANGRVEIDTQVSVKAPKYRPPSTMAKINDHAGGFLFSPDCSENPDQLTTNDITHEEE